MAKKKSKKALVPELILAALGIMDVTKEKVESAIEKVTGVDAANSKEKERAVKKVMDMVKSNRKTLGKDLSKNISSVLTKLDKANKKILGK